MVYLGPSKGCLTCRQRRKKCDETRPSCTRCIKSRRTCRGYEDTSSNTFRSYNQLPSHSIISATRPPIQKHLGIQSPLLQQYLHPGQCQQPQQPFLSEARRCTLPVRAAPPGSTEVPEDFRAAEVTESTRLQFAIRGFFYDCCVITTNTRLSRGFLSGVELLARQLGLDSYLVKACEAVAFGVHGKTLNRPHLASWAESRYQDLLGELAQLIDGSEPRDKREPWLVAMLLGVYQIVHAFEGDPGNHMAHSKGLAALLGIANSPLGLLQHPQAGIPQSPASIPQPGFDFPFFIAPSTDPATDESLDSLILATHALWSRFQDPNIQHSSFDSLAFIQADAVALEGRFHHWQQTRAPEFQPVESGIIPDHSTATTSNGPEVGYWPGRVDSYFDHYVAGAWNIFRATRLLVLYLIITLDPVSDSSAVHSPAASSPRQSSREPSRRTIPGEYLAIAHHMIQGILSSISYNLTDKLHEHLANVYKYASTSAQPPETTLDNQKSAPPPPMDTGRVLGGLLLLHPLHVAINMPFVSDETKVYMRHTLEWISAKGGVGQAGIFAKVEGVLDMDYLASSCLIIWAGFIG